MPKMLVIVLVVSLYATVAGKLPLRPSIALNEYHSTAFVSPPVEQLIDHGIGVQPSPPGPTLSEEDPGVQHTRLQLLLGLLSEFWGWLILAVIAFAGLSPRLRDMAGRIGAGRLGILSPYIVLLSLLQALLTLPLAFYSGFTVEHRFGLSNQDIGSWLGDFAKSLALGIVGSLIVFNLLYLLFKRSPRRWWLYGATVMVLFSVVLGVLAPVLISPLFNKFEPLQDQDLKAKIIEMTERSGVQVADVLQMDSSSQSKVVNAYFVGLGPTKRIVLYDTLLANFTQEEVLTIVAHETGHQVHNDIWRSIAEGTVVIFLAFYALYRFLGPLIDRFRTRLGFSRLEDPASLPLILLFFGLLFFLIQPIENTYSRYIEHEADVYALETTHENQVYATALAKLGSINVSDPDPPEWMEFIFYSHPSLKKRIEFALSYIPSNNRVKIKGTVLFN